MLKLRKSGIKCQLEKIQPSLTFTVWGSWLGFRKGLATIHEIAYSRAEYFLVRVEGLPVWGAGGLYP